MARTAAPWSKRAGLHDELHDAWHLLGRLLARSNRNYSWLQLAFLFSVTLVPFSTALLARFPTFRVALVEYWLNIVLLGLTLLVGLQYALRAGLLDLADSFRLEAVPGFHAWLEQRYHAVQHLGGGAVIYQRS